MPTLTAASNDGYVRSSASGRSFWADARDATTGTAASSTSLRSANGSNIRRVGNAVNVWRSFYYFDCSGISATVASATLKIYGYNTSTADVIIVKASAPNTDGSTALTTADFDAIPGFSAGASMSGNVTDYSSEVTTWSTSGYNDITLNAQALLDLENNSAFQICVVEYDHDYSNISPAVINVSAGQYYQDYSGTGTDPIIDYTLGGAVASVNGTAIGNISNILGTAKSSLASINGVDLP